MMYIATILFIAGYIIGSIPFGLILAKISGLGDIRNIGSGNIGATNVLRTGNKKLAVLTLLLDMGKGAFIAFVAAYSTMIETISEPSFKIIDGHAIQLENTGGTTYEYMHIFGLIAGFGAIVGHCFPVWLKFKGGKGVATAIGVFLAATPIAGLAAIGAWIVTALISKTSSLSALVAVLIAPIVTFFVYGPLPASISFFIAALIWRQHRENINRLIKGEESKISFKKEK
ncbi:MAG: glycerol-3-phosphate acyltransferase [Micavibrio sp.]|nr:MAG: glycerol-3-phosphate acyltransferase [Micavibrio sp.]